VFFSKRSLPGLHSITDPAMTVTPADSFFLHVFESEKGKSAFSGSVFLSFPFVLINKNRMHSYNRAMTELPK